MSRGRRSWTGHTGTLGTPNLRPGAGYPAGEMAPPDFQQIAVNKTLRWAGSGIAVPGKGYVWNCQWSTGPIWTWPLVRGKLNPDVTSFRSLRALVVGQVRYPRTDRGAYLLWDDWTWTAQWWLDRGNLDDQHMTPAGPGSVVSDEMRSANGHFRWELAGGAFTWRLRLSFIHYSETDEHPDLDDLRVDARILPMVDQR